MSEEQSPAEGSGEKRERVPAFIERMEKFAKEQRGIEAMVDAEDLRRLADVARRFFKLDCEAAKYVENTIIFKSKRFTGEPPYVGWKGLGKALSEDYEELASKDTLIAELQGRIKELEHLEKIDLKTSEIEQSETGRGYDYMFSKVMETGCSPEGANAYVVARALNRQIAELHMKNNTISSLRSLLKEAGEGLEPFMREAEVAEEECGHAPDDRAHLRFPDLEINLLQLRRARTISEKINGVMGVMQPSENADEPVSPLSGSSNE